MSSVEYGAAPVLDMITFGYRKLVKHVLPITWLALIPVITLALCMGTIMPQIQQAGALGSKSMFLFYQQHWADFSGLWLIMMVLYSYYSFVLITYVRDIYLDRLEGSLLAYLKPRSLYLGLLGICAVYFAGMMVAGGIMGLGFVLLVLPGLAAFCGIIFLATRYMLAMITYTMEPENGIWQAFKSSWNLTQGNFWRSIGLFLALVVINWIVKLPFSIVAAILGLVSRFSATANHPSLWFQITNMGVLALTYWAAYVLGIGGTAFVMVRYYFDLKSRKGEVLEKITYGTE